MAKYFMIAIFSGILSSFSQILLKKGAEKKKTTILGEYFNFYVITGYVLMGICMLLTVIALKGIPFKYSAVLEALVYLYIMVLSRALLSEKLTKKKVIGNIIIIIGVVVFGLGR